MVNSTTDIASNEKVTYSTLTNNFLNWLKTSCRNIDSYSGITDALLNPSYSINYAGTLTSEHPPVTAGRNTNYSMTMNIVSAKALQNSYPIVTTAEIEADFQAFMQARGINTKSNTPVIATGLLSFWNNVASFCSARIHNAAGQFGSTPVRVYKKGTVTYKEVPSVTQTDCFNGSDVTTFLNNLEETIEETSNLHTVTYNFSNSLWSSSCSSSSCSSSSSSSSSSSLFIGYMKLPA